MVRLTVFDKGYWDEKRSANEDRKKTLLDKNKSLGIAENKSLTQDEKNIEAMDSQTLLRVDQREARDSLRRQNLIGKESLMSNGFKGFDDSQPSGINTLIPLTGQNQQQLGHVKSPWASIKATGGGGGLSPSIGRPIAQLSQGKGFFNIKGGGK